MNVINRRKIFSVCGEVCSEGISKINIMNKNAGIENALRVLHASMV